MSIFAVSNNSVNMEEYKIYDFFGTLYRIYENGKIYNCQTKRFISGQITKFGYRRVCLRNRSKHQIKYLFIHRLVALCWLPNPDNLPYVNHKDFNRLNNSVDNLEWCTTEYNVKYSKDAGHYCNEGTKNPNHKLSKGQVDKIRFLWDNKVITNKSELGRMFNVSDSMIYCIVKRQNWKYQQIISSQDLQKYK